jgi:hypothetical protein
MNEPDPLDDDETTAAAREAVETILARRTAEDLRQALVRHDAAEAERRALAAAARARLVAQLAEAERADRVAAARERLQGEAEHHESEAARLAGLADDLAGRLALADAEPERLHVQRDELAAAMRIAAAEAEALLTSDPEQAGAIAAQNAGRAAALHGLDDRLAEAQRQRDATAAGAGLPPDDDRHDGDGDRHDDGDDAGPRLFIGSVDSHARDLAGLRARADWHRGEAQRLRWQAQDDPLGDGAEASAGEPEGTPSAAVLTGVLLAARRGFRELSPSRPARPFGFAPGSLGEAMESAPRRRR